MCAKYKFHTLKAIICCSVRVSGWCDVAADGKHPAVTVEFTGHNMVFLPVCLADMRHRPGRSDLKCT